MGHRCAWRSGAPYSIMWKYLGGGGTQLSRSARLGSMDRCARCGIEERIIRESGRTGDWQSGGEGTHAHEMVGDRWSIGISIIEYESRHGRCHRRETTGL